MLRAAQGLFRGAHGAETWGRPASEFPSRGTCPPGTPAHRAHLAAAGSRPASPPRSAPRPWSRAAARQPATAGALPGTYAGRPGHAPRLPPPRSPPWPELRRWPQAKGTEKPVRGYRVVPAPALIFRFPPDLSFFLFSQVDGIRSDPPVSASLVLGTFVS